MGAGRRSRVGRAVLSVHGCDRGCERAGRSIRDAAGCHRRRDGIGQVWFWLLPRPVFDAGIGGPAGGAAGITPQSPRVGRVCRGHRGPPAETARGRRGRLCLFGAIEWAVVLAGFSVPPPSPVNRLRGGSRCEPAARRIGERSRTSVVASCARHGRDQDDYRARLHAGGLSTWIGFVRRKETSFPGTNTLLAGFEITRDVLSRTSLGGMITKSAELLEHTFNVKATQVEVECVHTDWSSHVAISELPGVCRGLVLTLRPLRGW